ncbi:phosphotransferase [Luteolibacter marinus]|uniref:phosphotransferase n=1 Tax=Luteolibacter marinus TaxID=2776705 RepID=UPI0018666207|nr:phosphotransferase [Luteolibacter marinus]
MSDDRDQNNRLEDWLACRPGRRGDPGGWWLWPHASRPKLMIPVDRDTWPGALQMASHSRRTAVDKWRLPWRSLSGASPDLSQDAVSPLDRVLEQQWPGAKFHYAVYFGTESVFAKDTIQIQGPAGAVLGYLRVPRGRKAAGSIARERDVLLELAGIYPEGAFFPRMLPVPGLAVQGPPPAEVGGLPGPTRAVGRLAREIHDSAAVSLAWSESPVRESLKQRHAGLEDQVDPVWSASLGRSIEVLDRAFSGRQVPHGRGHGDFVPWNLRETTAGLFAFDWEWSRPALPFSDLFHFLWFPMLAKRRFSIKGLVAAWNGGAGRLLVDGFGQIPADPHDNVWALAYVADRFSFYSASCLENGDDPMSHRFIRRLHALLNSAELQPVPRDFP